MSNNPTGRNQHKDCPSKDDNDVNEIITRYHREGITGRELISELLREKHGIHMSQATVARRFRALGLKGAGKTTKELPEEEGRQLVADQMALDPSRHQGAVTIRESLAQRTGTRLTRDFVRDQMRTLDPEGSALREPAARKIVRGTLRSLGPNHEWSADGHDKLNGINFPIYGIKDVFSSKWLCLEVVPNNRTHDVVAYLYLRTIVAQGGMPLQSTTDCGTETTLMFGLANSLRDAFSPESSVVTPAHRFMRSVHNITIERSWRPLRIELVDNVKAFWDAGSDMYDGDDDLDYNLARWLWSKVIQQELDAFSERKNAHVGRTNKHKLLPSGASPNVIFDLPGRYGGENCLQTVDLDQVRAMMEEISPGGQCLQFVTPEYATYAQDLYDSIGLSERLDLSEVWGVFSHMRTLMTMPN
ncbi:hypothetical protein D9619_010793 [Psilocybe cf. subviscida]|uniref:Integrase core domain-containing protein n=1 Tax=Psilocybe cf. subviscida TaxID=2480587 RepID=A0A8H5B8F8_9AGAR|nr:hypothetical protein D9619_010793 [Psilocybe cf. subviscida]